MKSSRPTISRITSASLTCRVRFISSGSMPRSPISCHRTNDRVAHFLGCEELGDVHHQQR